MSDELSLKIQLGWFYFASVERILLHLHLKLWPHSLMDRMEDSGSFDLGSNPGGVTLKKSIT